MSLRCAISICLLSCLSFSGCAGTREHFTSLWKPLGDVVRRSPEALQRRALAEAAGQEKTKNGLKSRLSGIGTSPLPLDPFLAEVGDADHLDPAKSEAASNSGDSMAATADGDLSDEPSPSNQEDSETVVSETTDDEPLQKTARSARALLTSSIPRVDPGPPASGPTDLAARTRGARGSNRPPRARGDEYQITRSAAAPDTTVKLPPVDDGELLLASLDDPESMVDNAVPLPPEGEATGSVVESTPVPDVAEPLIGRTNPLTDPAEPL